MPAAGSIIKTVKGKKPSDLHGVKGITQRPPALSKKRRLQWRWEALMTTHHEEEESQG